MCTCQPWCQLDIPLSDVFLGYQPECFFSSKGVTLSLSSFYSSSFGSGILSLTPNLLICGGIKAFFILIQGEIAMNQHSEQKYKDKICHFQFICKLQRKKVLQYKAQDATTKPRQAKQNNLYTVVSSKALQNDTRNGFVNKIGQQRSLSFFLWLLNLDVFLVFFSANFSGRKKFYSVAVKFCGSPATTFLLPPV